MWLVLWPVLGLGQCGGCAADATVEWQVLAQCEAKLMRLMDTVEGEQASVDTDLVRTPEHVSYGRAALATSSCLACARLLRNSEARGPGYKAAGAYWDTRRAVT